MSYTQLLYLIQKIIFLPPLTKSLIIMNTKTIQTGDNVLISPDLTGKAVWTEGIVIEVENNSFNGIVIAAETKDRNVFFGQKDLFRTINNKSYIR